MIGAILLPAFHGGNVIGLAFVHGLQHIEQREHFVAGEHGACLTDEIVGEEELFCRCGLVSRRRCQLGGEFENALLEFFIAAADREHRVADPTHAGFAGSELFGRIEMLEVIGRQCLVRRGERSALLIAELFGMKAHRKPICARSCKHSLNLFSR